LRHIPAKSMCGESERAGGFRAISLHPVQIEGAPRFRFRCANRPAKKLAWQTPLTIGFLGAGKMGHGLARGFIRAEIVFPKEIIRQRFVRGGARRLHPGNRRPNHRVQRPTFAICERPCSRRETRPGRRVLTEPARQFHGRTTADFHRRGVTLAKMKRRCPPTRGHSRDAQHARAGGRGGGGVCARQNPRRRRMVDLARKLFRPSASRFK